MTGRVTSPEGPARPFLPRTPGGRRAFAHEGAGPRPIGDLHSGACGSAHPVSQPGRVLGQSQMCSRAGEHGGPVEPRPPELRRGSGSRTGDGHHRAPHRSRPADGRTRATRPRAGQASPARMRRGGRGADPPSRPGPSSHLAGHSRGGEYEGGGKRSARSALRAPARSAARTVQAPTCRRNLDRSVDGTHGGAGQAARSSRHPRSGRAAPRQQPGQAERPQSYGAFPSRPLARPLGQADSAARSVHRRTADGKRAVARHRAPVCRPA
jgi:hypothetical protein